MNCFARYNIWKEKYAYPVSGVLTSILQVNILKNTDDPTILNNGPSVADSVTKMTMILIEKTIKYRSEIKDKYNPRPMRGIIGGTTIGISLSIIHANDFYIFAVITTHTGETELTIPVIEFGQYQLTQILKDAHA